MIRPIAVLSLLAVAGCGAGAPEITGTPVSPQVMRAGGSAVGLLFDRDEGFYFDADDTAWWISRGSRLVVTQTRVSSVDDRQICLEPQGSWGGACLTVYNTAEGMTCQFEFGNGVSRTEACAQVSERWF